jgi:hypothetical protein
MLAFPVGFLPPNSMMMIMRGTLVLVNGEMGCCDKTRTVDKIKMMMSRGWVGMNVKEGKLN